MTETEDEVKRAEKEVKKSAAEFENAMSHLQDKVDNSGKKIRAAIQSVHDTVDKPRRALKNVIGTAQKTAQQTKMRPYIWLNALAIQANNGTSKQERQQNR